MLVWALVMHFCVTTHFSDDVDRFTTSCDWQRDWQILYQTKNGCEASGAKTVKGWFSGTGVMGETKVPDKFQCVPMEVH